MLELDKVEEHHDRTTGLYLMSCKAETGLGRADYRRNYGNYACREQKLGR